MPRMFVDSRAEADGFSMRALIFDAVTQAVSLPETLGEMGQAIQGPAPLIHLPLAGTGLEYDPHDEDDVEFEQQRLAFRMIPSAHLVRYAGEFVLSRDGQIVDHDVDLAALTRRSMETLGDIPVYIEKVGEEFEIRIDTPFLA